MIENSEIPRKIPKKMAEKLPNDIIIDILCRLPLKDIARFLCVSKEWNRMLPDSCVPKAFKNQPALALIVNHNGVVKSLSRNPKKMRLIDRWDPILQSDLIDSRNGLLLLRYHMNFYSYNSWVSVVYNLINKDFVLIPEPFFDAITPHRRNINAVLVFDSCISNHFKVVQFENGQNCCYVFCSETWNWSGLQFELKAISSYWDFKTVYLNGFVYKLSTMGVLVKISLDPTISSGDRARAIPLPVGGSRIYGSDICIGVTGEKIRFARGDVVDPDVLVWTLRSNNEEYDWVFNLKISVEPFGLNRIIVQPVNFDPVLDKIFILVHKQTPHKQKPYKVMVFDLNTQELEEYCTSGKSWISLKSAFPFVPCINVRLELICPVAAGACDRSRFRLHYRGY